MSNKKLLTIRIDANKLEAFKQYCYYANLTMSDVVLGHIDGLLEIEPVPVSASEVRDSLDSDIKQVHSKVLDNQETIDRLESRIERLEAQIERLDSHIDRLDNKIDNPIEPVHGLVSKSEGMVYDIVMGKVPSNIDDTDNNIDNHDNNIDKLDADIDNIDKIDNGIDKIDNDIDNQDVIDYESMTIKQIKALLDSHGIVYKSKTRKSDLIGLMRKGISTTSLTPLLAIKPIS